MSKVIICIHGLGNKPSPKVLTDWWEKSIREGLFGIGKYTLSPKIEMIYWADVLHEKPLDESITDKENPYYLEERYIPAKQNHSEGKSHTRRKLWDYIEKKFDDIILDNYFSNNFSAISDLIIHKYFSEFEIYYSEDLTIKDGKKQPVKQIIRDRVLSILNKHVNDQIFLIAHSMGSIIVYDVLTLLLPKLNIDTFITIGSPLGFPAVKNKIASEQNLTDYKNEMLITPMGITNHWYNLSDKEDEITIHPELANNFRPNENGVKPVDIIVNNNYEINGNGNPHKSFGYLRTPELSRILYKFMIRNKSKLTLKILNITDYLYSKIILPSESGSKEKSKSLKD